MLVYLATNTRNGKIYVGCTAQALSARIAQHKYKAGRQNCALISYIIKGARQWRV